MKHVFTTLIILLYLYTLVTIISVLLLENRNPVKSISWVLVLLFLPVLGMWLYLLFGQDYRKKKIISKKSIHHLPVPSFDLEKLDTITKEKNQINLIKLLNSNGGSACYANNKIELLTDGESTFNALFDAIRGAKDHIHIQFFIFDDDIISNKLRELLILKAKEGVRVRMIYDYWGSFDLSKKYWPR